VWGIWRRRANFGPGQTPHTTSCRRRARALPPPPTRRSRGNAARVPTVYKLLYYTPFVTAAHQPAGGGVVVYTVWESGYSQVPPGNKNKPPKRARARDLCLPFALFSLSLSLIFCDTHRSA